MDHVKEALRGFRKAYWFKPKLVPMKEMVRAAWTFSSALCNSTMHRQTDVLSTRTKELSLKKGGWVQVKRGKYHKDYGQVLSFYLDLLFLQSNKASLGCSGRGQWQLHSR